MGKKDKKLVVVADDFGWTKAISDGIIKSYLDGIVTEVSLIIDYPATSYAVQLAKERKIKDIGIHMVLKGLNSVGKILKKKDYIELFSHKTSNEIEKLAKDELDAFADIVGTKPTHVIPHYGIHGNLKLLSFLIAYLEENKIPMRLPRTALTGGFNENYAAEIMLKRTTVKTTLHLFAHVEGSNLEAIKKSFLEELSEVKANETAEIMLHPGYFDEEILKMSSLTYERARDLALSLDFDFRDRIKTMGFEFVSYSEL